MNHFLKDFGPGNFEEPKFARFFFACCSLLAYKSTIVSEEFFLKAGFAHVKLIECDGAQAYVLSNDEIIVVAFRGTEILDRGDIWADIKFWKTKGRDKGLVHTGFKDELDKLWATVNYWLEQNTDKILYITGHSLGGAMATLAASRVTTDNLKEIYTYGAPRVGNARWARNLHFIHNRIQNNNDLISRVPSKILGYRHQGMSTYINQHGYIRKCTPYQRFKDMARGRIRALVKLQFFDGVYDHALDKYCKKLHKQLMEEKDAAST